MRILAFDPGWSTGVAVLDEASNIEMTCVVDTIGLSDRFFRHISAIARPTVVLIESLPAVRVDEQTAENYHAIQHWFNIAGYETAIVPPARWKGMVERRKVGGQHAADAATMATWYWRTFKDTGAN